ncbi:hypothetical protein NECAME_16436 [Necator americanus]|uniref:Uncharacterized protein n=1 Tax=Necator americanus TaxID=51031 RepID=W2TYZ8_NECAM|nr:hypothetical protein NECAME_16436 [Necator americanus]ETN86276.1 hypothetical protein NECAME_16436 [Necator americanus]
MAFGLPMCDDVWRFFVEEVDNNAERNHNTSSISEWEWMWLTQVDALPRKEVDLSDLFAPAVQFTLRCNEYWIAMRPVQDFPRKPPEPSTLSKLVQSYREYCEVLDSAISQVKLLDNEVFTLLGYSLDENDNECIAVKLRPKAASDETITLLIDWGNPREFPRHMSSTDEERFSNLDCEKWDSNDDLHVNMRRMLDVELCEGCGSKKD